MSVAPAAPHTPAAAPHARSADVGSPCVNGMPTKSTSSAPIPEKQVTSGAGARLAASPPAKSPAPKSMEETAPTTYAPVTRGSRAAPALLSAAHAVHPHRAPLRLELLEVREER